MIELLFKQEDYQGVGKMLKTMWHRRRAIIKYREEAEKVEKNRRSTPVGECRSDPGPIRNCQAHIRNGPRANSVTRG